MGFLEKVIGSLLGLAWIVAGIVAGEDLGWLPGTIFTVLNLILPRDVFASFMDSILQSEFGILLGKWAVIFGLSSIPYIFME